MIRDFAKTSTKNRFPRTWTLSKNKLSLKSGKYVHLTTKGWQTAVILQWLVAFVCHDDVDLNPDLKTLLWTSQNCIGLLLEAKKFLCSCQKHKRDKSSELGRSSRVRTSSCTSPIKDSVPTSFGTQGQNFIYCAASSMTAKN